MHGKLLIITGLAVSGGTVAAAPHLDPQSRWRGARPAPTRIETTRPPDPRRFRVAAIGPVVPPTPRFDEAATPDHGTLPRLQAPDGRVITLPWRRGARDSAAAARARDSMAALLAPGQRQLACDVEDQPHSVRALALLAVDDMLIRFRLLRARSGPPLELRPSGYLVEMEAEPLSVQRVRELCVPLRELP